MSDPKPEVMGNQADEQGAFNEGADFANVNSSGLMEPLRIMPVEVTQAGNDLVVIPVEVKGFPVVRRRDEGLAHSPRDITAAQLTDEGPDPLKSPLELVVSALQRLAKNPDDVGRRESLQFYGITPKQAAATVGNRIIVLQDTLESEYSCADCAGKGYLPDVVCARCGGSQLFARQGEEPRPCMGCVVLGFDQEKPWSCGRERCTTCRGSGWKGGIVIPDTKQERPVTGVIVSIGTTCQLLQFGDRVLFSKYAGHTLTTKQGKSFTYMRESEVLSILRDI